MSDTRSGEQRRSILEGIARDVLLLCDKVKTKGGLARELASKYATEGRQFIDKTVDDLIQDGFLMTEGELLLTLPTCSRSRSTADLRALVFDRATDSSQSTGVRSCGSPGI